MRFNVIVKEAHICGCCCCVSAIFAISNLKRMFGTGSKQSLKQWQDISERITDKFYHRRQWHHIPTPSQWRERPDRISAWRWDLQEASQAQGIKHEKVFYSKCKGITADLYTSVSLMNLKRDYTREVPDARTTDNEQASHIQQNVNVHIHLIKDVRCTFREIQCFHHCRTSTGTVTMRQR